MLLPFLLVSTVVFLAGPCLCDCPADADRLRRDLLLVRDLDGGAVGATSNVFVVTLEDDLRDELLGDVVHFRTLQDDGLRIQIFVAGRSRNATVPLDWTDSLLADCSAESCNCALLVESLSRILTSSPSSNPLSVISLTGKTTDVSRATRPLRSAPLNVASRVYAVLEKDSQGGQEPRLFEVYKTNADMEDLVVQQINNMSDSIWARRSDLRGLHFRVGLPFNNKPYTVAVESVLANGTAVKRAEGYFGQILVMLCAALNASYSLVDSDGIATYGGLQSDNVTFDGLIGMLQARKIDLIVAELSVSEMRSRVCDFLIPIREAKFSLVISRLGGTGLNWLTYVHVFTPAFWAVVAVSGLVLVAALMLLSAADTWSEASAYVLACFTSRELAPFARTEFSARLAAACALTLGFVVFSAYNAVLTSFLSASVTPLPINSFKDVLKSDMGVALQRGGFSVDLFQYSKPGTDYYEIYQKKVVNDPNSIYRVKNQSAMDSTLGPERRDRLSKNYGLFMDTTLLPRLKEYPCSAVDVPGTVVRVPSTLALPSGSPLTPLFNHHLQLMRQSGVLDRLWRAQPGGMRERDRNEDCSAAWDDEDGGGRPLGFDETAMAFGVAVAGLVAAVVVAVAEVGYVGVRRVVASVMRKRTPI